MKLDAIDRKIISCLQGDLPLVSHPFAALARELELEEGEVVRRVQALADGRVMRRFGATLRHQRSGFASNVMVAWRVPPERAREVGERLAAFRQVSHCYWREPCEGFSYNLFSMVHGRSEAECRTLVAEMADKAQAEEFELLFSVEELKKTSMRYFDQEGEIHEG
ncbi:MAG: AsnC family transcriptional regulator [Desulfarculaceae bacterium]|nr:AsnC family transcriptional regulator [Desulfarculaceae bacterium]MCF8048163.1 AsnC family transcriptional regulator [Desulfarculaceae bacterium]MCF8098814.1 AsnC family transcriptional regulator [Desulfarculaceae bacterium]MCF8123550.1 AsnC family transcriptional regulator [Desulfarculaceae bacterium]